jgi:hypothetical protein
MLFYWALLPTPTKEVFDVTTGSLYNQLNLKPKPLTTWWAPATFETISVMLLKPSANPPWMDLNDSHSMCDFFYHLHTDLCDAHIASCGVVGLCVDIESKP